MTVFSRWFIDLAFAAPPQSGLAWFCFLLPSKNRVRCAINLSGRLDIFYPQISAGF